MVSREISVDTVGLLMQATESEIDLRGHVLEQLFNIFKLKYLENLPEGKSIKSAFYTVVDRHCPNAFMATDDLGGFESKEQFDSALTLAKSDRSGPNNRGFGLEISWINKLFSHKTKGGSGFIVTINKKNNIRLGYSIVRKSHKHTIHLSPMNDTDINVLLDNEYINNITNNHYNKNANDVECLTIYFAQAISKSISTVANSVSLHQSIFKGIKSLYTNYTSTDQSIINTLQLHTNIHMSKILQSQKHSIYINDNKLEYLGLMDDLDNYTNPDKIIEAVFDLTSYSRMNGNNQYIIDCLDHNLVGDKGCYKILRTKKKLSEAFCDIRRTKLQTIKDDYDFIDARVRIIDINSANWKTHRLSKYSMRGAKDFKKIYIRVDNLIIAQPDFHNLNSEWPNLRIEICFNSNRSSQTDIEMMVNLNSLKYRSVLNDTTKKIIEIAVKSFQNINGAVKTKLLKKKSRKNFSHEMVQNALMRHPSCSRTGIPLEDGFYDKHHKDEDHSNNEAENLELLHPSVHAHISRKSSVVDTITNNPNKYLCDEIKKYGKSEKLTNSDKLELSEYFRNSME